MSGVESVMTFASTHRVIQAESILLEAGVPVRVMPLPSVIRAGCGLCLRVPPERAAEAKELLARANAAPEGFFRRRTVNGASVYEADETDREETV